MMKNWSRQFWRISFRIFSFFQSARLRSATSELGQEMQLARRRAKGSATCRNWAGGMRLSMSSSSFRNRISFVAMEKGQSRSRAFTISQVSLASFSTNLLTQSRSCAWNMPKNITLCNGIMTFASKSWYSSFRGIEMLFKILATTSRISASPFRISSPSDAFIHICDIARRMGARKEGNFPYVLFKIDFRQSRSRGSSESNNSNSFCTNLALTYFTTNVPSTSFETISRRRIS
mmetsp:Transcript_84501/g.187680  ORF Transcript_84501/g.187680 Transcript_84501/m.187680 type:complete len:233 (-) Transcript_84501:832-1530(-)